MHIESIITDTTWILIGYSSFMTKHLTHKQHLFVQHYLANGGNGVEAAREAGYKGNHATLAQVAAENLRKPYIANEIDQARENIKMSSRATTEAKREGLWELFQKASKDKSTGDGVVNFSAAISAIAELNKMDGDYKKPEQPGQGEIKLYLDLADLELGGSLPADDKKVLLKYCDPALLAN